MSTDNHASYSTIGFTVFAGALAIVLALIYLGGLRGRNDEVLLETCYDQPVNGLSVGSAVNFRGVKIGEVREISFIGDKYRVVGTDRSRIYILMAVNGRLLGTKGEDEEDLRDEIKDAVVRLGLRATVTTSGITGLSRIECDFNYKDGVPEAAPITWTPHHPYIPAKISLLDSFSVAATKVMNQINRMDLGAAWSNVALAVESAANMMDSAKVMIETRQADLERILDDLSVTSEAVKEFVSEIRNNPSLLVRERIPGRLDETDR